MYFQGVPLVEPLTVDLWAATQPPQVLRRTLPSHPDPERPSPDADEYSTQCGAVSVEICQPVLAWDGARHR